MNHNINKFYIGQEASLSKSFTTQDVIDFSKLSLDTNPIHINDQCARTSFFKN